MKAEANLAGHVALQVRLPQNEQVQAAECPYRLQATIPEVQRDVHT